MRGTAPGAGSASKRDVVVLGLGTHVFGRRNGLLTAGGVTAIGLRQLVTRFAGGA